MGKAKAPHNKERPTPKYILEAIERNDMEAVRKSLTFRQTRFCEEFVVDFNGSAAAVRAGYSAKFPDRQANQLLRNAGVRAYIDHLTRSKEAKITAVTPDYIIQRVTEIINREGAKDTDKLRGLEMLARHLGMFIERTEITGKDGGAIKHEQVTEDIDAFTQMINSLRRNVSDEKVFEIVPRD